MPWLLPYKIHVIIDYSRNNANIATGFALNGKKEENHKRDNSKSVLGKTMT